MDFSGPARRRTAEGIEACAKLIGVDVPTVQAVITVETNGRGFDDKGRPKMLFEPHRFYALLKGEQRKTAVAQGLAYARQGTKPYPKDSYPRLQNAMRINPDAALEAASWGLGQIMGANCKAAGFDTAAEMVEAFCEGEDEQLHGMASFIVSNRLADELRRKDWAGFARGYNGPAYAINAYDKKLAKAYANATRTKPLAVAAVPVADDDPTEAQVEFAQKRLKELGYYEVGEPDGIMGSRTRGALLAFKADNDLPLNTDIDDAVIAAMATAEKRAVDPARATATAADLKDKSVIVRESMRQRFWSALQAIGAAVIAAVYAIKDFFSDAWQSIGPVREAIGDIPGWTWACIAGGIAGVMWLNSKKVEERRVEDYRAGKNP